MIYTMHRCPEVSKQSLWSYSISIADYIRNKHKINQQGTTHVEKLTRLSQTFDVKNDQIFGCQSYALDASLQENKLSPTWNERTRVGAYIDRSKYHASRVSFLTHFRTLHISPQFHVIFDENVETVASLRSGIEPS